MAHLPGSISTLTNTDRLIHIDETNYLGGPACRLVSTITDAGATPTTTIRKGCVVVKKTSDGLFYLSTTAGGDRNTAPTITSSGNTDTADGTVKLVGNHGTISVTIATGSGTEADVVTDLNASAAFAAHYVATSGAGEVTITARGTGSAEWFYIHSDTTASVGFAEGEANSKYGTNAEYYVTEEEVSTLDPSTGVAAIVEVKTSARAFYDESQLLYLTAEARAVLSSRGALFG